MRVADPRLLIHQTNVAAAPRAGVLLAILLIVLALTALGVRFLAFDEVVAVLGRILSSDGEISARNRIMLHELLVESFVWCAALGTLAFTLSGRRGRAWVRACFLRDDLETASRSTPNPIATLIVSTASGVAVISLWVLHLRTPLNLEWLYGKEGVLELLTFIFLMAGAVWCALAAKYRDRQGVAGRWIALSYAALGTMLFLTGMEEISWGQTYLAWQTPETWAAINSQQETTLHNLLDQNELHRIAQIGTYAFVIAALLTIYAGGKLQHPFVKALAPHPSMVPLLLLIAYAAAKYHLEISEILFAIFVACYSWRIYLAARTVRPTPAP